MKKRKVKLPDCFADSAKPVGSSLGDSSNWEVAIFSRDANIAFSKKVKDVAIEFVSNKANVHKLGCYVLEQRPPILYSRYIQKIENIPDRIFGISGENMSDICASSQEVAEGLRDPDKNVFWVTLCRVTPEALI